MVKRYLELRSLAEARALLTTSFPLPCRTEKVPLMQAAGRVAAEPVFAKYSVPEVNISAMDGIAVRSRDTLGASDRNPVTLEHCARVNTGNIIPPEFDAVVMIEDVWEAGDRYQIRRAAIPWQHVRPAGEDIKEKKLVIPRGHLIRPFNIGALATYGFSTIRVLAVNIGIIPTGSELVPLGARPGPGQVVESNTVMAQVFLTTDPGSIGRTLFFTGTLDPALEELANLAHDKGLFIHATNPGNFTGIQALKNNTCHAAPLVLPAQNLFGVYQTHMQFSEIRDLGFIHIARVELGIASRDGLGLEDLVRARFINTRNGTPSRSVLDTLLAAEGIDPERVNGYGQEVHGPPAVAAAIRNGFADAGICTSGIASANGLSFVSLAHQDYELAVRKEMLSDARIRTLETIVGSPVYTALLKTIGGYDTSLSGTIRELGQKNIIVPVSLPVQP